MLERIVFSIPSKGGLNPYIREVNKCLERAGVVVRNPGRDWGAIQAALHPGAILHLHWPSYFYRHDDFRIMSENIQKWQAFLRIARATGVVIIWTAHNVWPHEMLFPELEARARKCLVEAADHIIVHCQYAASLLQRTFGRPRRLSIIPHPCYNVDLTNLQSSVTPEHTDGLALLAFGVIRQYKNLEFLVEAFRNHAGMDDRLRIVGEQNAKYDSGRLRRLCSMDSRVSFDSSTKPEAKLADLFRSADIAVFTYKNILSSGAVALAQSFAKPVIAPRLGCLNEMVPCSVGELYEPDSAESFGGALTRIRGRNLRSMGAQARSLIQQETPETFAKKLIIIYASCGK